MLSAILLASLSSAQQPTRAPRQGAYEAFAASAIAALGRDGWELVTETTFGANSGSAPVLLFKRAGAR